MSTPLPSDTSISAVQGTWTPVLSWATPGTSSFAYTIQTGTYLKIGTLVKFQFTLAFTPTIGTGSGNLIISGLPFGVVGVINAATPINPSTITFPTNATVLLAVKGGGLTSTQFGIVGHGPGQNGVLLATTNFTTGVPCGAIGGAGEYYAAS